MPTPRHTALPVAAASFFTPWIAPANAEVILDFSRAPGATVGDSLVLNQAADPANNRGTTSATFTLDDPDATAVTMSVTFTGAGTGPDAAANIPLLRAFSNGGLGLSSAVGPASNDDTTGFDEVGAVAGAAAEETLILSFSEALIVKAIGLAKFDSENNGSTDVLDVLGVTVNGSTTTYASDSSLIQTINFSGEDQTVLVFDAPIVLQAGDTLTLFTADNGDAATKAAISPSGLFVTAVPEPGAVGLAAMGLALLVARRR